MPEADPLIAQLRESRARTRRVADDLGGARELGPVLAMVNPPRWELGHVGWFQEHWCLRRISPGRYAPERSASILPNADALYNSATVPHDARWGLPLPPFEATLSYRDEVLAQLAGRLARRCDEDDAYFVQLAVRHEDMHAEAFHCTRQTLAYPAPLLEPRLPPDGGRVSGDAEIAGGVFPLGTAPEDGFAFDNEKWAHAIVIAPFCMARAAVTNAEFTAFVDAGAYGRAELWSIAGWRWLQSTGRRAPLYWQRAGGHWEQRRFDRWHELRPDDPVVHVSWYEADAYCRFAGRRLPTEAEWELAATWDPRAGRKRPFPWGDAPWQPERANLGSDAAASVHACPLGDSAWGLRQMIGNVWEWTASTFLPYPGFLRDPYAEYSAPWFGTHKVLRGGSFSTPPRVARATFRNFYTPDRADIFAGFRTCALEAR